jgi:hypothetical protein|tara:strand:+ start:5105 stop:5521 length:417 start_codon:yes stop_codon:yes gene_type:complete
MKYILILLSVMLIACTTTPTKEVSTPKVVKPLVSKKGTPIAFIFISCISLEATKNILEGDKISKVEAAKRWKAQVVRGLCGLHNPPVLVGLDKVEVSYIDHDKKKSQLWKIKDRDLWALVAEDYVKYIEPKQSTGLEV